MFLPMDKTRNDFSSCQNEWGELEALGFRELFLFVFESIFGYTVTQNMSFKKKLVQCCSGLEFSSLQDECELCFSAKIICQSD